MSVAKDLNAVELKDYEFLVKLSDIHNPAEFVGGNFDQFQRHYEQERERFQKLREKQQEEIARLKSGDVVRLKSGGPPMTVIEYSNKGISATAVDCSWFDDNRDRAQHSSSFPVSALEKVPD